MFLEDIVSALDLTKACFFSFSLFLFLFLFPFVVFVGKKKYYIGRRKEIDPLLFKGLIFVHFS